MEDCALRDFTPDECVALLGASDVAHIALSRRSLPVVEPVHYRLAGDLLVIVGDRADAIEHSGTRRHVVCLETDGLSGDGARWVVQVTGVLDLDDAVPVIHLDTATITGRQWSRSEGLRDG